jgi:Flp pilus assembly protein TadD
VPRYRQFLANHHFNRAMALRESSRGDEAIAAVSEACRLLPHDPEQWVRKARILAVVGGPRADDAIQALRKALELGLPKAAEFLTQPELKSIQQRPDFVAMVEAWKRDTPR